MPDRAPSRSPEKRSAFGTRLRNNKTGAVEAAPASQTPHDSGEQEADKRTELRCTRFIPCMGERRELYRAILELAHAYSAKHSSDFCFSYDSIGPVVYFGGDYENSA